jgi:hypothetical protein
MDLEISQIDIKNAYLNGILEEEIYMKQPQGYIRPGEEHLVYKLKKTLYGLKQSGHKWYKTFCQTLMDLQFVRCPLEWGLFKCQEGELTTHLLLYVDDILLLLSSRSKCTRHIGNPIALQNLVKKRELVSRNRNYSRTRLLQTQSGTIYDEDT